MKETMKRYLASWVLLAVFLPMLLLSSFHTHDTTPYGELSCADCVQHHCSGHLGQQTASFHQCVLCQFLTLTFVTAIVNTVVCHQIQTTILYAQCRHDIRRMTCGFISLRAPPAV